MTPLSCEMPVTVEGVAITRQGTNAVYYNVTVRDATGRQWITHNAAMRYDLAAVGGFYVGIDVDQVNPKIVAGPFDAPPPKLLQGHTVYILQADGTYLKAPGQS